MKKPSYTSAPISGEPERRSWLKDVFAGHRRSGRYFEGRDQANGAYLMWMEYSRFGMIMAYPCVLAREGEETLVFDTSPNTAAEENNARLLEAWEALALPERKEALEISPMEEKAFRAAYRKYQNDR